MTLEILSLIVPGIAKKRAEIRRKLAELPYHVVFRTGWRTGFAKWYCFDNLVSVPRARAIQLNALAKQADLNLTRDDLKAISVRQAEIGEAVKAETSTLSRRAASLLESKPDPAAVKKLIEDVRDMNDFVVPSARVWENLNREIAKRCELLTHPEFLYKAAAVLYWTDGEDPTVPVTPEQLEEKVAVFKKKDVLLPLLRSPISAIFYHVEASPEDLVISLRNDLARQEPFLKFGDEIIKAVKTRSSIRNYNSDSISATKKSTSSAPSEGPKMSSENGPPDLKSLFSNSLKDAD